MRSNPPLKLVLSFVSVVAVLTPAGLVRSEVKLPAVISNHMVLQADVPIPIWGSATPGEEIVVTVGTAKAKTTAETSGRWAVQLPQLGAGGPFQLSVKGTNELTVNDVMIGEVWLGSGQSNMAMTVNRAKDFEAEQAAAEFPAIRMFTVASGPAEKAQDECRGEWVVCSPQSVSRFSATAYFFGRELHKKLRVPVGLINSSVGGTPIESWISPEAQKASLELKPFFAEMERDGASFDREKAKAKYDRDLLAWQAAAKKAKAAGTSLPKRPQDPIALRDRKGNVGGLFNGKIAPLVPYRIRGVIWYQGEANSTPTKAPYYEHQLALLIKDWRTRWGYDFPFAWVQLPNFGAQGRTWPVVREAMRKTLSVPNTGMAITLDIGDEKDIHPTNKQEVGRRLALWALGDVYGQPGPTSGPLPIKSERRDDSVVVTFNHAKSGLVTSGEELSGFELGDDNGFKPAAAKIDGDSVVLTSNEIAKPTQVRYAWENNPKATLLNKDGLPASPFQIEIGK